MSLLIGFSKPKRNLPIFSWLIRWFENSDYSHTYLKFELEGQEFICEAVGEGVRILEIDKWKDLNRVYKEFVVDCGLIRQREIKQYCMTQIGTKYGVWQIFGIAIAKILNLSYNPLSNGVSHQICSEFVARIMQEYLGYTFNKHTDLLGVTDIYNKLN